MSTEEQPKIIIIGGGVGGLTLAQSLLKSNIPFHIFERDTSHSFRAQGYRIRIDVSGVLALQKILPLPLWERLEASAAADREIAGFTKIDALSGEEVKGGDPPGGPLGGPKGGKGLPSTRTEDGVRPLAVDRTVMREVLLTGLEAHISYGKSFERYEITSSSIVAHFRDGTSFTGTFLVGADGVRSSVRKQYLPQIPIVDTMGRCIYGKTYITPELIASIHPKMQNGIVLIQRYLEDGTPITLFMESMRFPNPDLVPIANMETKEKEPVKDYMYWVLLSQEHIFKYETADLLRLSPIQATDLAVEITKDWSESVTPLLMQQSKVSASALRIVTTLPEMPTWKPSSRITLLGDAAHPMPPTAGLGALSALKDVEILVDAIKKGTSEDSIGAYEEEMRKWVKEAVGGSRSGGVKFFGQVEFAQAKPVVF